MSDLEVINKMAQTRMIETIISNNAKGTYPCTDDLAQDIYVELIEKTEKKPNYLVDLYKKKHLNFYVTRIVMNNLFSKNSRYYYNYMRWYLNRSDEEITDNDVNTDEDEY